MASSFTIMRVRGIPIGVHWSWLIIFGIFVWSLTKVLYPAAYPGLDGATYLGMGIATALLFFGSVLLHELSHALLSEREGIHIEGISLWLLGGVARLRGQPGRPSTEARIAGVGPLVSVILGLLFRGLALLANRLGWPEPVRGVSSYLAQVNLILAGFNLVPALPLDGGRVLRAWLWDRQRSYYRATRSAVRAGKAFGSMLIALGVLGFLTGTDLGGLWFVLLGWFLIQAAQGEMEQAEARQALRGLLARALGRPCHPGCDGRDRDLHGHRTADRIAVRDHWRRPAAVDVAVVSGAGAVGAIAFRVGALIFDVRNLVAYGGITIGGAMTASTLTGRRFADRQAGGRGRGPVRVRRDRQGTADVVRPAVGEALVPALPLIRGKHCRRRH